MNLTINGTPHHLNVPPDAKLSDLLRHELGLTGTKTGCGEGKCGACTVLLDGRPVRACVYPVRRAEGKSMLTVEGLAASWGEPGVREPQPNGELHPLQQAFIEHGAVQCGFCTPGLLMSAAALWNKMPPLPQPVVNLCQSSNSLKSFPTAIDKTPILAYNSR